MSSNESEKRTEKKSRGVRMKVRNGEKRKVE
jgi:hypothetical protein